ncbi:MAG TPA: TIGR03118 family protein [Gemmataceae bacterium]|jgi:uncharacterized protein (TIGR03118 family)|nr:TIGR03118 family protein [Gemmataceae bacterium]
MFRWIRGVSHERSTRRNCCNKPARPQLSLERLECRTVPSGTTVLQTNLVSDLAGVAAVQDPHLVNPWGISESSGSPFWISDNNAGVSTLYNVPGANNTPVSINPLVVSIPTPGDPLGASGTPTGTVFNIDGGATGGFKISGVSKTGQPTSASAIFLFATEDGTIVGWNPGVNPTGFATAKAGTYGIIAVDNSGNNFTEPDPGKQTGAVYKGLSIASSAAPIFASDPNSTTVLYVTNFRTGQVEVYDTNFKRVTLPTGAFSDKNLPSDYAPFNVQVLNGKVYVTYAKQNANKHDDVAGHNHGFVDVFNLDGTPGLPGGTARLITRDHLDSPWGLALAPSSFGSLAGDLLVGNFGNGFINVFNPTTGAFLGQLKDPDGEPIQIDGLWALKVGNGKAGGDANTVYFTAGLFGETHGLFGSLSPVAPGTPEGPAEMQMVIGAFDVFQMSVKTFNTDLASGAPRAQLLQDLQAVQTDLQDFIRAEVSFVFDSIADHGGFSSSHNAFLEDLSHLFTTLEGLELH